jgi:hypothetical protein
MNEIQGKHSIPLVWKPLGSGSIITAATTKEEEEQETWDLTTEEDSLSPHTNHEHDHNLQQITNTTIITN